MNAQVIQRTIASQFEIDSDYYLKGDSENYQYNILVLSKVYILTLNL